jgi:hypothetical protein
MIAKIDDKKADEMRHKTSETNLTKKRFFAVMVPDIVQRNYTKHYLAKHVNVIAPHRNEYLQKRTHTSQHRCVL